jgi:hypothetical protein
MSRFENGWSRHLHVILVRFIYDLNHKQYEVYRGKIDKKEEARVNKKGKKNLRFAAGIFCCSVLISAAEDPTDACIQWNTTWPDAALSDGGLDLLPDVTHYTIYKGTRELGMYNHGPMVCSHNGMLFVAWYSHSLYEDAAGTRTLYSFSKDMKYWSCVF